MHEVQKSVEVPWILRFAAILQDHTAQTTMEVPPSEQVDALVHLPVHRIRRVPVLAASMERRQVR